MTATTTTDAEVLDTVAPAALKVRGLVKTYGGRRGADPVVALDHVDLDLPVGGTLGIIGESGSGKSTLARSLLGLITPDSGSIELLGQEVVGLRGAELRRMRRDVQIVFQEPFESLDPRMQIGELIAEPLVIQRRGSAAERAERVAELLTMVSLPAELADRFPHQLSGGQQQRVNIARALATSPRLVVLDEPTASLDVSVRADILRLLARLRVELGLSLVLISHDLPTIRSLSSHIAVVSRGCVVEHGPAASVLTSPEHEYTRFLLASELPLDPAIQEKQ